MADGVYTGQITDRPLARATAKNRPYLHKQEGGHGGGGGI